MQTPSLSEEKTLKAQGYQRVAGIDEVGRGAWAGPVVAAAVILPPTIKARQLDGVKDSKLLSPARRELLSTRIHEVVVGVGVGIIDHESIDKLGIATATRLAMKLAVEQLVPPPDYLLIDYLRLPEVPLPQKGVVDGDSLCFSIASASIIAKVTRDRLMVLMDGIYPGYGLAQHKGYGTDEHLSCLNRLGPCPIHRRSFQPVRDIAL